LSKGGNDFFERDFPAHNHYVNVARRGFPSGSNGAIYKSQLDPAPESGQALVEDLRRTEGLADEPAQLVENRAFVVCLKIRLPPFGSGRSRPAAIHHLPVGAD
jgi:hypothetical protein